jgi:hypothetical protein
MRTQRKFLFPCFLVYLMLSILDSIRLRAASRSIAFQHPKPMASPRPVPTMDQKDGQYGQDPNPAVDLNSSQRIDKVYQEKSHPHRKTRRKKH